MVVDVSTVALPVRRAYEDIYISLRDYQIPGAYCLWMLIHNSSIYRLFHFIFPLLISIPYIYTMDYRTHAEGISLCEPMYYSYKSESAYAVKNEYMFGILKLLFFS